MSANANKFFGKVITQINYITNAEYRKLGSGINDYYILRDADDIVYEITRHYIEHTKKAENGYGYRTTEDLFVPVSAVELHTKYEYAEDYRQPEKFYIYDNRTYKDMHGVIAAIIRETYDLSVFSEDVELLVYEGKDTFRGKEITLDELKQYYTEGVIE